MDIVRDRKFYSQTAFEIEIVRLDHRVVDNLNYTYGTGGIHKSNKLSRTACYTVHGKHWISTTYAPA